MTKILFQATKSGGLEATCPQEPYQRGNESFFSSEVDKAKSFLRELLDVESFDDRAILAIGSYDMTGLELTEISDDDSPLTLEGGF